MEVTGMIFFFTSFQYSNKATVFAFLMDLIAYGLGIAGLIVLAFAAKYGAMNVLIGFSLIALAIFFYFFLGRKVGSIIAKNDFKKKIYTNPIVAYNYVNDGRATYDEIAAINPAFKEQYVVNEFGKLTRRRK